MSENTDIKTRLKQLRQGRPWQLLMIGDGISQITAEDVDALTRILDLFPHVGGLDVTTSAGSIRVSRDFSSDYTSRVDQLLAGIFARNPAVTGITFPAASGRPGHTATPADPHWSAQGQAIEGLSEASRRGEITAEEMARRLKAVEGARAANMRQGYTHAPDIEAINERFVRGEIDLPTMQAELLAFARKGR